MYITDEGRLTASMIRRSSPFLTLPNLGINSTKRTSRKSSRIVHPFASFKMKLDDIILFKEGPNGIKTRYFVIIVKEYDGSLVVEVEKSYDDFKAFSATLRYHLRGSGVEAPKLEPEVDKTDLMMIPSSGEMFRRPEYTTEKVSAVEDQMKNISKFCKKICSNQAFFLTPFYNFFNIPEHYRVVNADQVDIESDEQAPGTPSSQSQSSYTRMRLDGLNESVDPDESFSRYRTIRFRTSSGKEATWDEYKVEMTVKYCIFFHIYLEHFFKAKNQNYYLFSFRIQSIVTPEINYIINKRYSEFTSFAPKLKASKKARFPVLPKRIYLGKNSHESLKKRGIGLREWLLGVCNEKMFHSEELFQFIELPIAYHNLHLSFNPMEVFTQTYSIDVTVRGFEMVDNPEEPKQMGLNTLTHMKHNKQFCLYNIQLTINHLELRNQVSGYVIRRRFREFNRLNKNLKKTFAKYKTPLPELEGKTLRFMQRVSHEERQYRLQVYLRSLLQYPDIFDCLEFRKFLLLTPQRFGEFKTSNRTSVFSSSVSLSRKGSRMTYDNEAIR